MIIQRMDKLAVASTQCAAGGRRGTKHEQMSEVGTELVVRYKGKEYRATVERRYRLQDGQVFETPSGCEGDNGLPGQWLRLLESGQAQDDGEEGALGEEVEGGARRFAEASPVRVIRGTARQGLRLVEVRGVAARGTTLNASGISPPCSPRSTVARQRSVGARKKGA